MIPKRTIAIVLCDNDFFKTFMPLLEGLVNVLIDRGDEADDKFIGLVIRQSILAHYVAYQYHPSWSYNGLSQEEHLENTGKYLSKIRILFDEEAEKHIAENDHDGGSWYLELYTGRVSGY